MRAGPVAALGTEPIAPRASVRRPRSAGKRVPAFAPILMGCSVLLGLTAVAYGYRLGERWYFFSSEDYPAYTTVSGTLSREDFSSHDGVPRTVYILNLDDGKTVVGDDLEGKRYITRLQIVFQDERTYAPIARSLIGKHVVIVGQRWLKNGSADLKQYATEVLLRTGYDGACSIVEAGRIADDCLQKAGWYEYGDGTPSYTFSGTISRETRVGRRDGKPFALYVMTLDVPINIKEEHEHSEANEQRDVKRVAVTFEPKDLYNEVYMQKFWSVVRSATPKHVEVTASLHAYHSVPGPELRVSINIDSDDPDSIKILSE